MTTILADTRLGVMVSDSSISDGDRQWAGRKVWRARGRLLGFSGDVDEAIGFLTWFKAGCTGRAPKFKHSAALTLGPEGLFHYAFSAVALPVLRGVEAVGSGGKAAMCAYEAQGWEGPAAAVAIVCKHDTNSRKPIRTYYL